MARLPYWLETDLKMLRRINVIEDQTPSVSGHRQAGASEKRDGRWWSRRITQEHRLVYRVSGKGEDQAIEIASCRFHYGR